MHEQYASHKAESLAVANIAVHEAVGLEQVKQGQLTTAQLEREVGVARECPSWNTLLLYRGKRISITF